jgi:hypothetical protein
MTAAKQRGTTFEVDLVSHLRERGHQAERLARTGAKDEGDVALIDWHYCTVVIEAKARREKTTPLSIGAWLAEAHVEAENYRAARSLPWPTLPVLVVKRPNKPIGQSYVILTLDDFLGIE